MIPLEERKLRSKFRGRAAACDHSDADEREHTADNHIGHVLRGTDTAVDLVCYAGADFSRFSSQRIFPIQAHEEYDQADNDQENTNDLFHNATNL